MRSLIYSMNLSLDGYIAGPGGDISWGEPDPELHRVHNRQVAELGGHLLGRRLYEVMGFWETPEASDPSVAPEHVLEFGRIWRELPKIVYSTTLSSVEGSNTRLSHEDPVEEVRRLKQEPGKPLAVGGAGLAGTLMRAGLIDEYRLFLSPVILGGGTPFFGPLDEGIELELVEGRTLSGGVVFMRYRAA